MNTITLSCGPIETNTYILTNDDNNECVAIDPADSAILLKYLEENNLHCRQILLTHGHFDHILGLYDTVQKHLPEVWIHSSDSTMLTDSRTSLLPDFLGPMKAIERFNTFNGESEIITCVGTALAIPTPGHTPGSCCYVFSGDKTIFTGDTIFYLGMGRTDFSGSSYTDIIRSIQNIQRRIPGDYEAFPGHGPATTMEDAHPLG